ncbi:hypothetical protein HWV03_11435 [Moritella sp. 36]|uniref:hypothetical protein n=1 Tax=Moritella sp. 36 TaxID=2746233 RepID=UPI001BA88919|nr:hypothetical protein [Moritella sp. 36]QUM89366.1 hypothetical protein HWV03_11435 [Moritella sp. 36]
MKIKTKQFKNNLALGLIAMALTGCGGSGGGSTTTVTPAEPQKPYKPEHAINLDILNLNDGGNVDTEKVENTARLVSAFYDQVINNIFSDLNLPEDPSIDNLRNYMAGKTNDSQDALFRSYVINNTSVHIVMKKNSPTNLASKDIFEDQSNQLGDRYYGLGGFVSFDNEMTCLLMLTGGHESLRCGNGSSAMELTYRKRPYVNDFDLKINDSSFSFPKTSVEFDPNTRSVTLNTNKKAALNSDKTLSWEP